jgi:hypothetical protein
VDQRRQAYLRKVRKAKRELNAVPSGVDVLEVPEYGEA